MSREFAVESGVGSEDVPTPPQFTAQSADEDEMREHISEWRSEVRALGLDPSAALRIMSSDSADASPADDSTDAEPADAPGEGSPSWATAARDAAPSIPEGWRPSSLFADDGRDDDADAADAPTDRPTGVFAEPDRTDDAVEASRRDSLPGLGPGEYEPPEGAADADADADDAGGYEDVMRAAREGRPSSSARVGVNYVGLNSMPSSDGGGEEEDDDEYRPSPILTADPDDDEDGDGEDDDEHRPSGLFTDPEGRR